MTEKELKAYELGKKAGIDEAVERIIVHIQRKGYDRQFAEDFIKYDTIKALQDKK